MIREETAVWSGPTPAWRRLEIDNNIAENAMRSIALGRKNYVFAGSDTGGDRAAAMYSIEQTSKLNGVNPEAYLGMRSPRSPMVIRSAGSMNCCPGRSRLDMATQITIEPTGAKDTGTCDCCGRVSRCVWGLAYAEGRCLAAYYVCWTLGHVPNRGANIDLILGEWGEATTSNDRRALALAYRLMDTGPSMMVIDAQTRPASGSPLVGRALRRDDVIGTASAQEAFAIADAVLAQDERVVELLGGWRLKA
jgi:Transposase IS66 family